MFNQPLINRELIIIFYEAAFFWPTQTINRLFLELECNASHAAAFDYHVLEASLLFCPLRKALYDGIVSDSTAQTLLSLKEQSRTSCQELEAAALLCGYLLAMTAVKEKLKFNDKEVVLEFLLMDLQSWWSPTWLLRASHSDFSFFHVYHVVA